MRRAEEARERARLGPLVTNEEIDPLALLDSVFRGPSNDPLPHEETARLRRHMADLAAQHGISLLEKDIRLLDAEGSLSVEKREITVPTVSSASRTSWRSTRSAISFSSSRPSTSGPMMSGLTACIGTRRLCGSGRWTKR